MTNLIPRAERAVAEKLASRLLYKLDIEEKKDADKRQQQRTKTYLEILELARHFMGEALTYEKYLSLRDYISDPDHRWMRFIGDILDHTDPGYAKKAILSLGFEAFFRGTKEIRASRKVYGCNIPWLILFDPTMACNMHCIGCWSGTYDHKDSLTYEEMDRIVSEGKQLGTHLYMLTGGEPLVRKKDIMKLCEKHSDCFFAAYTNSTLIDEQLCRDTLRLGNLMFLLSIEGTPDTNDARRGEGHYAAVMRAMDLLRQSRIPFGISVCYTSQNIDSVTSDEFFRFVSGKGALFGFYFHYMPVGKNAVPALMPSVEQRRTIIDRIRRIRSAECDIPFFPMDFQNDGEYVGGCIAGGRNYFHINAHGRKMSSEVVYPQVGTNDLRAQNIESASSRFRWKVPVPLPASCVHFSACSPQSAISAQHTAALFADLSTARKAPRSALSMHPDPVIFASMGEPPSTARISSPSLI